MLREDLASYLIVLGEDDIIARLPQNERFEGRMGILGCLSRVCDQLNELNGGGGEPLPEAQKLVETIKHREVVNGDHPIGHPLLEIATRECAEAVWGFRQVFTRGKNDSRKD